MICARLNQQQNQEDTTMTELSLVAKVKAAPGHRVALRDALERLVAPTEAEEGCLQYTLHESLDDPDTFVFVERWRSVPLWQRHMDAPHVTAFKTFAETHVAGWELLQLRETGASSRT